MVEKPAESYEPTMLEADLWMSVKAKINTTRIDSFHLTKEEGLFMRTVDLETVRALRSLGLRDATLAKLRTNMVDVPTNYDRETLALAIAEQNPDVLRNSIEPLSIVSGFIIR